MSNRASISVQTQSPKNQKRQTKQNRSKRRNRRNRQRRRAIPVAYSFSARASAMFKQEKDGSTSLTSTEIFPVISQASGLSYMLPMTPTKWANTRTCALAYTYASHRPLSCTVSWEPAVATSTSGSVAIGTVFAGARLPNDGDRWENISRALACTNGGFISTIWDHHTSSIALARNLRANQFPLYEVSADDIPFWVCVATSDTSGTTIGYLVVTTKFTLRNPLSGSISQPVTGSSSVQFTHDDQKNETSMSVPQSAINRVLGIGADYTWTFARNLINGAGAVVSSILSPITARLSGVSGGNYVFSVDSAIATQSALGYVIGQAANFI